MSETCFLIWPSEFKLFEILLKMQMKRKGLFLKGQVSIKGILILVSLIAGVLSLVANEPLRVAMAAVFCFVCWATASSLFFWGQRKSFQTKFTVVSVVILCTVLAIVISNFVLENGVHKAKYLVQFGWVGAILLGYLISRKLCR